MAGLQIQGAGGSVVEAGAFAAKGLHGIAKPQDYGALGHYRAVLTTGTMAAGMAANGEIIQMRWVDATRFCLIYDVELLEFLTDYLRLIVSGNTDPFEIGELMELELETYKHEGEVPAHSLARVGDALPALGIVAAVLGVVHALASADLPPSEMGQLIAHAMVGTFLGILLAYGFVSPLATLIEHKVAESLKSYQCIKVTLMASLNGYAPQLAVEFGRKILGSTERPSFTELDTHVREVKNR